MKSLTINEFIPNFDKTHHPTRDGEQIINKHITKDSSLNNLGFKPEDLSKINFHEPLPNLDTIKYLEDILIKSDKKVIYVELD